MVIEKLPSGSYRARIATYVYVDGKRKTKWKSFTAQTKDEARYLAVRFQRSGSSDNGNLTLLEACQQYIDMKKNLLSPNTITGYDKMIRNYLDGTSLAGIPVDRVRSVDLQRWIGDVAKSPKTIRNAYGVISATLKMFRPEFIPRVTLPAYVPEEYYVPSAGEIATLLRDCNPDLRRAIILGAFGGCRMSEALALTSSDIDLEKRTISITKALAIDTDGSVVTKAPKTYRSKRIVTLPESSIEVFSGIDGNLVRYSFKSLKTVFKRHVRKCGLNDSISYHTLRHFFASELVSAGVPIHIVERMGGWSPGSPVLRKIYIGVQAEQMQKSMATASAHFDSVTMDVTTLS